MMKVGIDCSESSVEVNTGKVTGSCGLMMDHFEEVIQYIHLQP